MPEPRGRRTSVFRTPRFAGPAIILCVNPEQFTYPPYSVPLVEAYDSRFEAAFIVLHPFIRVAEAMAWKATGQYPTDQQILAAGAKLRWTEAMATTGLGSCARMNQALLTSIGAVREHLADPDGVKSLQKLLENEPVWMPTEGRFEPLLHRDLLYAFQAAGAGELIFVPEFPAADPIVRLDVAGLRDGSIPFPVRGTLLAPDAKFLFTVDWDSFFTMFYGRREFIRQVAGALDLEGFFATPNTEHAWFNYTFGCATVTLSPEHWQTVK